MFCGLEGCSLPEFAIISFLPVQFFKKKRNEKKKEKLLVLLNFFNPRGLNISQTIAENARRLELWAMSIAINT